MSEEQKSLPSRLRDNKKMQGHRRQLEKKEKEFREKTQTIGIRDRAKHRERNQDFDPLLVKKPEKEISIALEEGEERLQTVQVADDQFVILTNKGIYKAKLYKGPKKTEWKSTKVFYGNFKPIERLLIDGTYVIRYESDFEQIDNLKDMAQKMRMSGGVLHKNLLDDCINAVCLGLDTRIGHATPGVYVEDNKLKLCLEESMPIKDEQETVKKRMLPSFEQPLTVETVEPYLDLIPHWHLYEIYPCMGLSAISPFALELRKAGKLVPIVWHHSPIPRLGKSTTMKAFSYHLYRIYPTSGDGIASKYRFSSAVDSINSFRLVDEANSVNWNELEDLVKMFPENYVCSSRGTSELKSQEYKSRAVLGITTNTFKIKNKSAMTRILKVEYDSSKVSERGGNREQVEKLKSILSKLESIGWRLTELELKSLNNSFEVLLTRLDKHESEIAKLYPDMDDPRRYGAWAVVYEGLKIWELASKKFNLDWRVPSYQDFVDDVVKKIEGFGQETEVSPIYDFLDWWDIWRSNAYNLTYIGEIYQKGKIIHFGDKKYSGDVITTAILREYKKDKNAMVDNLADLATSIQAITGIPKSGLLKSWNFGETNGEKTITRWGLFVPSDIRKFRGMKQDANEEEVNS